MIDDKTKIEIIKTAIQTEEGWKNLALSVKVSANPDAKKLCIELLRKIGEEQSVENFPVVDVATGEPTTVQVNLSDLLVLQLENLLETV